MHGTDRIVLMGAWPTKKRHQPVAGIVRNLTVVSGDCRATDFPIGVDQRSKIFGIQFFRELGRPYEITEHHCDLTDFRFAIL